MKKELIKTYNYLLVVDDSEIKVGDWFLSNDNEILKCINKEDKFVWYERFTVPGVSKASQPFSIHVNLFPKKIIFHLPLNDATILEGVPLLPLIEVEDNNKDLFFQKQVMNPYSSDSQSYSSYEKGFVEGYNKAREEYKFTEEHAKYLFECGRNFQINADITFTVAREHLLQPKTPTYFEFEIERKSFLNLGIEPFNPNTHVYTNEPKITTNSQGQQVACGKYIY